VILLPADVILTRSNTFLGRAIRFAERRPGDPAVYNHAGIVTRSGLVGGTPRHPDPDNWRQAAMVEALWHVRLGEVWDYYGPPAGANRPEVAVYRPTNVPSNDRSAIAAAAEEHVGQRYGWWKLFTHLGDSALSALIPRVKDVRLLRRLNFWDARPICSVLVAWAFASRGYDFGVPAGSASPDDIHDYVERELGRNYVKVFEGRVQ
jgi:hypothetical protein